MICNKCNTPVPDGTGFCPGCGERLSLTTGSASNKGLIITVCITGGIALAALVLLLVLNVFSPSPSVPNTPAATGPVTLAPTATPKPSATVTPSPKTPKTAAPSTVQDAKTVFANGFEMDIAAYLSDSWWASSGYSLDNPDAVAVGTNYPRTYNLFPGEVQYVFHGDTETVTALQFDENQNQLHETEVEYRIDPFGFYIYAFDSDVSIDGKTYTIYSKFFVCDDVLYEVQMIGDDEVSNYIAYALHGP